MVSAAHLWTAAVAAVTVGLLASPVVSQSWEPTNVCARNALPRDALDLNYTTVSVGYRTWGLVYLNETIAFAAANMSIAVLDTTNFTPVQIASIPLPDGFSFGNDDILKEGYGFRALTLSNNKENLYVATGFGAVIYDVEWAIANRSDSIVGVLSQNGTTGSSAIELSITPEDDYVFISQEFGSNKTLGHGTIEVYSVTRQANRTVTNTFVGWVPLGFATIGQQFSKDKTKLFVTSEMKITATALNQTTGIISVLDVAKLKKYPKLSLITTVEAGCHPVRAQMSTDGDTLWVTLRDANQVLAFDANKLTSNDTTNSLLTTVNTGTSPIGITAVGSHILTADSNRFNYTGTTAGVTVVYGPDALNKGVVDFPQIPTGAFARALAVSPSGNTLLVAEFEELTVRAVDISSFNL